MFQGLGDVLIASMKTYLARHGQQRDAPIRQKLHRKRRYPWGRIVHPEAGSLVKERRFRVSHQSTPIDTLVSITNDTQVFRGNGEDPRTRSARKQGCRQQHRSLVAGTRPILIIRSLRVTHVPLP